MRVLLSDQDHESMDAFLASLFDQVRLARVTKHDFIEQLAYLVTAVDQGVRSEAMHCFSAFSPTEHGAGEDALAIGTPSQPVTYFKYGPIEMNLPPKALRAARR
jgi:hypothetical protein